MRIAFVPSDPDGPGSYRCIFPMEQLARNGHDARLAPHELDPWSKVGIMRFDLLGKGRLNDLVSGRAKRHRYELPDADVFVLQMPQQPIHTEFTLAARAAGRVVVGEVDDDFVNLSPDHPAWLETGKHPGYNRYWMRATFQACDGLTVSTPHLAKVYEQVNPRVRVLPNFLNWDMWRDVTPQYELDRERVRIGWYGSASLRPRDVALLEEVVVPFLADHPEVDFVLAGDNRQIRDRFPAEQTILVPGKPFRRRPGLTDLSNLPSVVATCDIGLVPLVLSDFNEGKSCLKGMEYAACGIPCVASPTGPYREWVEPGRNGFLAGTPAEWREALEVLLDRDTRRRMGAEARKKASKFTIQRKWHLWGEWYGELRCSRVPYMPGQFAAQAASAGRPPTCARSAAA